jgi:hypothetical protein
MEFGHPVSQHWEEVIPVQSRLHLHLRWWLQKENLMKALSLNPPDSTMVMFTNASLA